MARRGRPAKAARRLDREIILAAATERLANSREGPFSLRLLAADLGVTPMALYSHVDGIDGILDGLAERWFTDMPDPGTADPGQDLRVLLPWYCERVMERPGLTSALTARRGALPAPHRAWTERVSLRLATLGLAADWSDILVDHLHGFALSQAVGGADPAAARQVYTHQLDLLLEAMDRVATGAAR